MAGVSALSFRSFDSVSTRTPSSVSEITRGSASSLMPVARLAVMGPGPFIDACSRSEKPMTAGRKGQ